MQGGDTTRVQGVAQHCRSELHSLLFHCFILLARQWCNSRMSFLLLVYCTPLHRLTAAPLCMG